MNRLGTGLRIMFHLPMVWIALTVITLALVLNHGAAFADVLANALNSYNLPEGKKTHIMIKMPKSVKSLPKTNCLVSQ